MKYYLRSTARAERDLTAQSTVTTSAGYPHLSPGDPIHVYIDHSNLTIGGSKAYRSSGMGHIRPWNYDVLALRDIIMQNLNFIDTANPESVRLNIYGADLDKNKDINRLCDDWKINSICKCPRNCKRKEKKADTQLTADMVTQVTYTDSFLRNNYSQSFAGQCVFVLISGDSDMIPAMESPVNHGFYVYVWAWKHSLSPEYENTRNLLAHPELVGIHYLDNYLEVLTQKVPENRNR